VCDAATGPSVRLRNERTSSRFSKAHPSNQRGRNTLSESQNLPSSRRNRLLFSRPLVIFRFALSEKVPNLFAPLQFVACQLFLRAHLAACSKGSFYFVSLKEALEQSDSGPSRVSAAGDDDGAAMQKRVASLLERIGNSAGAVLAEYISRPTFHCSSAALLCCCW
jgi:hypothetical protein